MRANVKSELKTVFGNYLPINKYREQTVLRTSTPIYQQKHPISQQKQLISATHFQLFHSKQA
jgi:hypothetical protein